MKDLDRPRLRVDFNEMVEQNLFLLSANDEKLDSSGTRIVLAEGMRVYLYMEDASEAGEPTMLTATGTVERNRSRGWSAHVKWCCRIDAWD
jgi:hypothetical protein